MTRQLFECPAYSCIGYNNICSIITFKIMRHIYFQNDVCFSSAIKRTH